MERNFRYANLNGRSFQGQDLSGFDFEGANIRCANFSAATLIGTNFKGVKAGLSTFNYWLLIALTLFLTAFTSFITAYSTVFLLVINLLQEFNNNQSLAVEIFLDFCFVISIMRQTLKKGLSRQVGFYLLILVAITLIISAVAATKDWALDAVTFVILQLFALAGIAVGGFIGCLIIATQVALSNRIVLLSTGIIACTVTQFGISSGLVSDEILIPKVLAWVFALGLTTLVFLYSSLIGNRASQGDIKFDLIRTISVFLLTFRGTQFTAANLTDADFTEASISCSNFYGANLTRTRWLNTQGLTYARTAGTYLENNIIRQLLVSGYGQSISLDYANLRGLNLQAAKLADASLVGADLSYSNLQGADLSRAKLVQTQLHETQLGQACLTGAYIQDWGISLNTQFDQVQCDYVYMHMPTAENPDPCRKPDNRSETFKPDDFADFITPIIKTLDLYQRQNVDPRAAAQAYKTIDLFHHEDIDPAAVALALNRLANQYPEAGLEVVALEGRGNDSVRLQARISNRADPSELSQKYFEQYGEIKELPDSAMQSMLEGIEEKDNHIRSLETMVTTALQQSKFYVETLYNMGDIVTEKNSIQIEAGGNVSGVVVGDISGVMNLGTISGNVTNSISQISETTEEYEELKSLLSQLQVAIETDETLSVEDKSEALEQVKILAESAKNPEDTAIKKGAKTAMKILKGTVAGISETTKLVQECTNLLPAISALLLLL